MIWRSNYLAKYNNDNISQNNLFTASWVVKRLFVVVCALFLMNLSRTNAQNVSNQTKTIAEVSTSDILSNITKRTWVDIPEIYRKKLEDFISNSKVMQDDDWRKFTEDFIVDKMKSDRGIKKENQELFIRDCIYEKNTWKNIYEWEDWDEERLNEYEEALDYIEQAWKDYIEWFNTYMQNLIADAQQRSANALNSSLENLVRFYNRYKKDPSTIKDEEVRQRKAKGNEVILRCKEIWLDYKLKLTKEIREFYGVE